jgi:hypothetical protein
MENLRGEVVLLILERSSRVDLEGEEPSQDGLGRRKHTTMWFYCFTVSSYVPLIHFIALTTCNTFIGLELYLLLLLLKLLL